MFTEEISELFRKNSDIEAVFLHGSYAKGTEKPGSDVDIGILPRAGKKFTDSERAEMANDLSYRLRKDVDVGEISSRNLVYAKEVIVNGRAVYVRDQNYLDLMTMTLLSMYVKFNEDRKEVLNAWYS